MNEPLPPDTKCLEALKRLDAIEADMKRQQDKWLDAYAKRVEAEEHARRRAMPWYKRLWEDFYWWRVQERFQGEVYKLHSEWMEPPKEPPGGGLG